ncbi:MAG: hypothetical protein IKE43_07195 [Coriobacteriales bacterium]|nr:hypothetical protein [Coriobacteriales bacterium]
MEQVNLKMNENVRYAMETAFDEAKARLSTGQGGMDPFIVTAVDDGYEFNDIICDTPEEVRESVKMLLAQDMPEGYALCYDGFVETDDGELDAVIVEVAGRGSDYADCLALLYTLEDSVYTFEADYYYTGPVQQLYPAGTKPIISGLTAIDADQNDGADSDCDI